MELVKVDHTEFGIQENKAKEISAMFKPMLDKMVELEAEANDVIALKMGPEAYARARELRLEYKRTRTGTATIHKDLKAFYLQGGRFVDGWKNAQAMASQGMEEKLLAIENHEELEKQRKIDGLQEKRTKALKKYELEVVPDNLGELDTVSWNNYLTGTKVNFTKRKEKEQRDEEEALEKDRILQLGNMRNAETVKYADFIPEYKTLNLGEIKDDVYHELLQQAKDKFDAKVKRDEENERELERLRKQSERREKDEKKKKDRQDKMIEIGLVWNGSEFAYKDINFHWTDLIAMSDKDFKKAVDGATERMTVIKQEEKDLAAKNKKEKDEGEKAKKELKDRQDEEERKRQEELNADDATKVESLVKNLEHLAQMYTFKSVKNQKMYDDVGVLIGKTITHIYK